MHRKLKVRMSEQPGGKNVLARWKVANEDH